MSSISYILGNYATTTYVDAIVQALADDVAADFAALNGDTPFSSISVGGGTSSASNTLAVEGTTGSVGADTDDYTFRLFRVSDSSNPGTTADGDVVTFALGDADGTDHFRMQLDALDNVVVAISEDGSTWDEVFTFYVTSGRVDMKLPSRTVAGLASVTPTAGRLTYVSDGTSNKRFAIGDGTNWRFPDGNIVS